MPKLVVDLAEAKEFLREKKAQTVILQIPEGLKTRATEFSNEISGVCKNVFVKMDPCFGACDLPLHDASVLNADAIIHIGHGPIHKSKKIFYVPGKYVFAENELKENIERLFKELGKMKIGSVALVANAQYTEALGEIKKALFNSGIKCFLGTGTQRVSQQGQILGCNYSVVEAVQPNVDASVYFGDGYFHPLGLVFSTEKPVIVVDPIRKTVEEIGSRRDRLMRKRYAAIARASEAKSFGIIISIKSGQRQKERALEIKKVLGRHGRKAFMFEVDLVNESYFTGVGVDCLVNTACNRIVLDDAENWKTLIINPTECLIAIGEKTWEQWKPDEFE